MTFAFGKPASIGPASIEEEAPPGLWVEQDQFVIKNKTALSG